MTLSADGSRNKRDITWEHADVMETSTRRPGEEKSLSSERMDGKEILMKEDWKKNLS